MDGFFEQDNDFQSVGSDSENAHDASSKSEPQPTNGNKTAKAAAKKKGGNKGGGRPAKTKDGRKWCRGHECHHDIGDFAIGSAVCREVNKANENIRNSAIREGKKDWYEETFHDDDKFRRVIQYYLEQCPPAADGKKSRASFPILEYIETQYRKSAVLADRIMEPMDLREFEAHMGKPKNGGLRSDDALVDFDLRIKNGDLYDHLGKHPKRKERILVEKKQQLIFREEKGRNQTVQTKGAAKKKATEADIAAARHDMEMQPQWTSSDTLDKSSAKTSFSAKGGAFGSEGFAQLSCPSIVDLAHAAQPKQPKKDDPEDDPEDEGATSKSSLDATPGRGQKRELSGVGSS